MVFDLPPDWFIYMETKNFGNVFHSSYNTVYM